MNKIGIIGYGNMGSAIFRSLSGKKDVELYDPYKAKQHAELPFADSLHSLVATSDVLLLCVKPNEVVPMLRQIDREVNLISVAAGIGYSVLSSSLPPGSKVVRTMPNLPLQVGKGALAYFGDSELYEPLLDIFSEISYCLEVKREELLNAVTGVSGSGPAYVFAFLQALAEGGVANGLLYDDALRLALETVIGSCEIIKRNLSEGWESGHPSIWRNRVTSPGGTTIAALAELEKHGFHSAIMEAVSKATKRSEDLGK